ncbi:MAG: MBOAT family protein [Clostridiales bacterium]|nr:MBOAT family protein [Clostridiales bacterium]
MVFSSLEFLYLYIPVCLLVYFMIPPAFLKVRNLALLIVSLLFYGWSEPVYVFIMIFSIIVDYICGYFVDRYLPDNRKKARRFVIASAVINLSVLGFFKYADFLITNLAAIPALRFLKPLGIPLPVGISFYTFQTMSYTLDVYMGHAKRQTNIVSFGAYVTMFPQLIAGPIVRYQEVAEELRGRAHTIPQSAAGIRRFTCGLCKKVLLANPAGALYETFAAGAAESSTLLGSWLGILFFAFQIYFDFSGYSDMAIGLGSILGFHFPENFRYPYTSRSITDFWRRWHITLSTWFREYVYIPLGGNRKGKGRTYFNLFVVWFLTGLWHGASWNFIGWGLYFCFLLILEKAFLLKILDRIPRVFSHLYALFFILIGWLIFIACDLPNPIAYAKGLFVGPLWSGTVVYDLVRSLVFLAILCIASTPLPKRIWDRLEQKLGMHLPGTLLCPPALLLCTAYLVDSSYNPFLYFRF